ncbi:MAG: hypothetical protein IT494_00035 [Gammaproteobacteria bacterium]|nr:hypothetical protein [Gammaproteobacteria bacterium]
MVIRCASLAAVFVLLGSGSTAVLAQQNAPTPEQLRQMQQMMGPTNQMMSCLANIDQSKLEVLGARAEAGQQELKKLCAAGQRDAAQRQAMAMAKEYAASPDFQALAKCGEMAKNMMPAYLLGETSGGGDATAQQHVCESLR